MRRRGLTGARRWESARHRVFALALVLLASTGAADETEVRDSAGGDDLFEGIEEVLVWGVRTGRLNPVPSVSTDSIDVDDYTAENKGLVDLLQESPGVTIRRFGGPGDPSEIAIRGSTANQVVVTVDGIRANSVLTGGLDLSNFCLPLIDRVEVTRGAGSIQEGSGAIGGTVNLVSRGGATRKTTRAALDAGSFDTVSGSLLHADRWGELDYAMGYCGLRTEGDFEFQRPVIRSDGFETRFDPEQTTRINNERVQHGANLALGWDVGPGRLSFLDLAYYASSGEPGIDSGNGVIAGQRTDAHSRNLANLAQLRWESGSPTGWGDDFSLAAYHRFERNGFRDPRVRFDDPIDITTRIVNTGLRAHDTWQHAPLGQALESRLSLDVTHEEVRSTDRAGRSRPMVAGAIHEQLGLLSDRLLLSAGARVDWTDGFDPQVLPALGLVIDPAPWIRLRGQAGRAYRAPTFDELFLPDQGFLRGTPTLSPEDAWNLDAGLEVELEALGPLSSVRLSATGFLRKIDESIVWVRISLQTIAPINTGSATSRGVELEASFDVGPWAGVSANYTWTDSERDDNGARLAGQPEHETFVRLRVGPEKTWKIVTEMRHATAILVDEGGSLELPDRTIWNLSASVDVAAIEALPFDGFADQLWFYARLDNLSDEAVRDSVSFPQPGRNASAGFEVRW